MIKSFGKLTKVDPGFRPDNLLVFDIGLPPTTDDTRDLNFYQQVVERLQAIPGVARVGAISRLPFSGGNSARSFNLPGNDKSYEADIRISTPDYFRTMNYSALARSRFHRSRHQRFPARLYNQRRRGQDAVSGRRPSRQSDHKLRSR